MSITTLIIAKWLPVGIEDFAAACNDSRKLENDCNNFLPRLDALLNNLRKKPCSKFNSLVGETELQISDLEGVSHSIETITRELDRMFKLLTVETIHELITFKLKMWRDLLWKVKLKITYFAQEIINEMAPLFIHYGETLLILTLRISVAHNDMLGMDKKYGISSGTIVCHNTCPYLMFPMKKISVTKLLQIVAYNRAELCCHKLIDCLLETYKFYENSEEDNCSDDSSLEIYMTLTQHMSPPDKSKMIKENQKQSYSITDSGSFANLEELISYEKKNVLDLLGTTLKVAPGMLGRDGIKKSSQTGTPKIDSHARKKVLDYYEQIMWGEVGNYLEHVILWWAACPLSTRPPHSSQHLREWIVQFIPSATEEVPPAILSTLAALADALGAHVASTAWDRRFGRALVTSRRATSRSEAGGLFVAALQELVTLCNQAESTPEWALGAPLEELPLVEQIPVLHRLDHTIYTTRLWAVHESKKLANSWNVKAFFAVTNGDIVDCLNQLSQLRLADHTAEIEKGNLSVHVQVCSLMRAKLVSEVKTNLQKLKDTPKECVDGLASVCKTIALANLQMIFPPKSYWKQTPYPDVEPEKPSVFVDKYLDEILVPVLDASVDPLITNMALTLICEAWLDHIYTHRIKFSGFGARQLLQDFAYVSEWLLKCANVDEVMRKKLLKNEILKRCEGVGRLLLRRPGERINMAEKNRRRGSGDTSDMEKSELMPAEMYVIPNQEQWLELRVAKKKKFFGSLMCCEEP